MHVKSSREDPVRQAVLTLLVRQMQLWSIHLCSTAKDTKYLHVTLFPHMQKNGNRNIEWDRSFSLKQWVSITDYSNIYSHARTLVSNTTRRFTNFRLLGQEIPFWFKISSNKVQTVRKFRRRQKYFKTEQNMQLDHFKKTPQSRGSSKSYEMGKTHCIEIGVGLNLWRRFFVLMHLASCY